MARGMSGSMARRLRVVTLLDSLTNAEGGERIAALIALGLDPERFESTLCTSRPSEGDPLIDEVRAAGIGYLVLDRTSKTSLLAWRPLVRLLREQRIDVLHAHKFGSNVWGAVLGTATGVPVIVAHEHTWSYEGQPLRRLLDRELIARRADVLLAVSREDQRRMVQVEGIPAERTRYVPNGVVEREPVGTDVRGELGIPADAPVVAAVGGLRAQKAFDVLVESIASLSADLPEVRCLIAGSGPEEAALRAAIARLGLDARVHLLGRRSDVADILAAADVAVLSSDFEGSPLVVMEYMAAGKPVVATRVGGVPDLIEDGREGVLVERRDPRALAEALRSLLVDPERRLALGERGRERQRREFAISAMVTTIELLYEELFAVSKRARQEGWRPPSRG